MPGTKTLRRKAFVLVGVLALALSSVAPAAASEHEVQAGDTLFSIASQYGLSVEMIAQMNGIENPHLIFAGQLLSLAVAGGDDAASGQGGAPVTDTYTVQGGETLWSIAAQFGISVAQLVEANRDSVPDQNLIYAGQQLIIPGGVGGVGASASQPDTGAGDVGTILHETAVAYGLDPALVQAIAWQESGWQQHVVSSAGAVGVMQVMPATGGWVSSDLVGRPLDIQGSVTENVLAGVVYLEWLLRYTGNEDQALAAYYQGPGSVSQVGWFIDTHHYVSQIHAIRSHIQLYGSPPR